MRGLSADADILVLVIALHIALPIYPLGNRTRRSALSSLGFRTWAIGDDEKLARFGAANLSKDTLSTIGTIEDDKGNGSIHRYFLRIFLIVDATVKNVANW